MSNLLAIFGAKAFSTPGVAGREPFVRRPTKQYTLQPR
jgi:hypothetical protein